MYKSYWSLYVILHPAIVMKVFLSTLTFLEESSYLHGHFCICMCVWCMCLCIFMLMCMWECVYSYRGHRLVSGVFLSCSPLYILRHANAVLHGFWDSCMWALGTWPLVLMPSAISTSTRSHLSSPTLGSVICSIILSISRNNEHLKISFRSYISPAVFLSCCFLFHFNLKNHLDHIVVLFIVFCGILLGG